MVPCEASNSLISDPSGACQGGWVCLVQVKPLIKKAVEATHMTSRGSTLCSTTSAARIPRKRFLHSTYGSQYPVDNGEFLRRR